MSSYEIFLLAAGFFSVLAIISLASMILDQGSPKIFLVLAVLSAGAGYLSFVNSPDGRVDLDDIPPAINTFIGTYLK